MDYTLESFINYCDEMQIAEEGLFSKKLSLDKSLFDLSEIPEDRKSDAESIIHDILSHKDKYEDLSKQAVKDLLKLNNIDKLILIPTTNVKMTIASSDGTRKIELKNGTKGNLKVSKGDITCSITLLVKHANHDGYKTYVVWIFVNNKILIPINCYTAK